MYRVLGGMQCSKFGSSSKKKLKAYKRVIGWVTAGRLCRETRFSTAFSSIALKANELDRLPQAIVEEQCLAALHADEMTTDQSLHKVFQSLSALADNFSDAEKSQLKTGCFSTLPS